MNSDVFNKAEVATAFSEIKAVYTGVIHIRDRYNIGTIDNYEEGRDYCAKYTKDGDTKQYYLIYGLDVEGYASGERFNYNEAVIKNLGISELKRTYIVSFDDGYVELLQPLIIGAYEVRTYEDMINIQESGVI